MHKLDLMMDIEMRLLFKALWFLHNSAGIERNMAVTSHQVRMYLLCSSSADSLHVHSFLC